MMYLLIEEIKKNPYFLNFNYLSQLSKEDFKILLKGNVEIPLLEERYNNLITLSKTVLNKMNGDFYHYVKNINLIMNYF